jgi:hypothetical protein
LAFKYIRVTIVFQICFDFLSYVKVPLTPHLQVLDTVLDAETEVAELEVMIGLSSQMCKIVPEDLPEN